VPSVTPLADARLGRRLRLLSGALQGLVPVALAALAGGCPRAGSQPTVPPWPMFGHDAAHTGLSDRAGPQAPKLLWSHEISGVAPGAPAVGADGTVYVGSGSLIGTTLYFGPGGQEAGPRGIASAMGGEGAGVTALGPGGTAKWEHPTKGPVLCSPALGPDGTIYVCGMDGQVSALTAEGGLRWECRLSGSPDSAPTVGPDGVIYVAPADGSVYAIAPDGTVRWRCEGGAQLGSSPALDPSGTVYVGSTRFREGAAWEPRTPEGRLLAVTAQGTVRWRCDAGQATLSAPVVGPDGTVYVAAGPQLPLLATQSFVLAVAPDGTPRWRCKLEEEVAGGPALGPDGTVYIAESSGPVDADGKAKTDGQVCALGTDGTVRWRCAVGTLGSGSLLVDSAGVVYVAAGAGTVCAVAPDGTLKGRFEVGVSPRYLALGADGTLYGAGDGIVCALRD